VSPSAGATDDPLAPLVAREEIRGVIQRTAALLDAEDLDGWLALFAPDSEYEIAAYGPEIRADMAWWKSDRADLARMLAEVPQHVRDPARRLHLVSTVSLEVAGARAEALSHFAVYRTLPAGTTEIYAAGRYQDRFVKQDGRWLYAAHRAVLDTRMLDMFTHLPL